MKTLINIILGLSLIYSGLALAKTNKAAKVLMMRGKVYSLENGKKTLLKKGAWVNERVKVFTKAKSFVRLLFIDKSSMNLGPKSEMVIETFPKKKAGVITLLKGQLRSKVTKNYMEMKDKDKSKLFIKTPTAAMGIRGTDFQVNFNPDNRNTSLITFSGAVAMAQLPDKMLRNPASVTRNQGSLEKIVSSPSAVMVKKGQVSGVMPGKTKKAMTPVKLHPGQLEAMKKNDGSKIDEGKNSIKKKKMRSILPKGMSGKEFSNGNEEMEKEVKKMVGTKAFEKTIEKVEKIKERQQDLDSSANEDGKYNGNGAIFNTEMLVIIPPQQDGIYDENTGTFATDPRLGTFNPDTGEYMNTEFQMNKDGEFIPFNEGRTPASTDENHQEGPKDGPKDGPHGGPDDGPPPVLQYNTDDMTDEYNQEVEINNPNAPPPEGQEQGQDQCDVCSDVVQNRDQDIQDNNQAQTSGTSTRVNIQINAQ